MNVAAQANLRSLNTGVSHYANDSSDLLPGFSWKPNQTYTLYTAGEITPTAIEEATARQAQDILARATRQLDFQTPTNHNLHLRYTHLTLLDYLTDRQPEPIAASPFDRSLQNWQHNSGPSPVPYAEGLPKEPGYDTDPTWTDPKLQKLWRFGTSFQTIPHAYLPDDHTKSYFTPSNATPHHMITHKHNPDPAQRKLTEVAHPSAKIYMYEEFDRFQQPALYASDPNAKLTLAYFDGSVRQEKVSTLRSAKPPQSSSPTTQPSTQPDSYVWNQIYLPLDTFPLPAGGLDDQTPLDLRFRWTFNGLGGFDTK